MPVIQRRRGARPSPRHRLAGATPHRILGETPEQMITIPAKLSYWLNDIDGDCVTAEEAAKLAMNSPEIFVADAVVQAWATAHGVLNGADLISVLDWMAEAGFVQDGNQYNDGPAVAVDWTDPDTLKNAIAQGPVKLGIAGDQLENVVGTTNGWLATGFTDDTNEDHCVSLCGYGSISWLLSQLGATVPSGVDGTQPGYGMFTWATIGVIDIPSMLAITGEAWLRSPNTVIVPSQA